MAIKKKSTNETKNNEIRTNSFELGTSVLENEKVVPSSDKLYDLLAKNIIHDNYKDDYAFNESVNVLDYDGSASVPMVFFVTTNTDDANQADIPLAYSPYNDIFKYHTGIVANDQGFLNAIKVGMSLDENKMQEENKAKLSKILNSRYYERSAYLSQMWECRVRDLSFKLAIEFISHLYMNLNNLDVSVTINQEKVVTIIERNLHSMVYECNGSCNDLGAHINSESKKINNSEDYVNLVLDTMYSSIKTPETINLIMMQLYTLVEEHVVAYLSESSGFAVYNYEEMMKENADREEKCKNNKNFTTYNRTVKFSNDAMHKSGISIDQLYSVIINRTLPAFEKLKDNLILTIIQLRYEVSVMFKNLSFGSNNKEDIKQIFEYNESKQDNDNSNSNSPIYITSF